jgi:hypothetical protein
MIEFPLERVYGKYRLTIRKTDHANGRPTPHIEIWKGNRKLGNFDMATGRPLFKSDAALPKNIITALTDYINDKQVQDKIKSMIEQSFFDLSKPIGTYGGIPRGFRAILTVEFTQSSLKSKIN